MLHGSLAIAPLHSLVWHRAADIHVLLHLWLCRSVCGICNPTQQAQGTVGHCRRDLLKQGASNGLKIPPRSASRVLMQLMTFLDLCSVPI